MMLEWAVAAAVLALFAAFLIMGEFEDEEEDR